MAPRPCLDRPKHTCLDPGRGRRAVRGSLRRRGRRASTSSADPGAPVRPRNASGRRRGPWLVFVFVVESEEGGYEASQTPNDAERETNHEHEHCDLHSKHAGRIARRRGGAPSRASTSSADLGRPAGERFAVAHTSPAPRPLARPARLGSRAHVATVDRHGRVTARNPGRFGLEARMTGMEVYPAPGRQFNDRFWSAATRGLRRPAAARRGAADSDTAVVAHTALTGRGAAGAV